jgi:hypothetical protein
MVQHQTVQYQKAAAPNTPRAPENPEGAFPKEKIPEPSRPLQTSYSR